MIKSSFILLLFAGIFSVLAGSDNDIIAEVDGIPLKKSEFFPESRKILAANSSSKDVLDISTKAAVELEVKLRTTLDLLKSRNIQVNSETAHKYIVRRCSKYPKSGKHLEKAMQKQLADKKFQLKSAIYFFVDVPEVTDEEIANFYHSSSHLFRRTTPRELMVLKVSDQTPGAEKIAGNIRSALLQGQNIHSVAAAENSLPEKADAKVLFDASNFKLRKNGVTPVFKSGNFWCVAVCTQEEKDGFAPLENVEAFIDEELLSRRCGAAFDKILKREISKKNIKYRR